MEIIGIDYFSDMSSVGKNRTQAGGFEYSPMPNTFQCILKGPKMHVFVTYFPINHYQLGVAHSNEVQILALRSSKGQKGQKNLIVRDSYINTKQREFC